MTPLKTMEGRTEGREEAGVQVVPEEGEEEVEVQGRGMRLSVLDATDKVCDCGWVARATSCATI